MKGGKNYYLRHFNTITGILLVILWMLAVCGIIWWIDSSAGVPPSTPAWLCAVIYDEDGKLEPLAYLIGLSGIISLFLSAVNKLSAERAFGILLRDVANFFFPSYHSIMLWFHGFFLVFGGYCCKKDIGASAAVCLFGLALCSVYGSFMCAQLSGKNLDDLVISYVYYQCWNTGRPFAETQLANSRTELHHFADYIHQQWQDDSTLQLDRSNKPDLEGELVLTMSEMIRPALLPWETPEWTAALANDMEDFFRCSSSPFCSGCQWSPCSWFQLHGSECAAYQSLHDAVQEYNMLWDRLLLPGDAKYQARLAGKVLAASLNHVPQTFMPLTSGLLFHLRLSGLSIAAKSDRPENFSSYIAPRLEFLAMIMDEYEDCFPRGVEKPEIKFAESWGQLAWLAVAELVWLLELRWPSDGKIETSISRFQLMLKALTPDQNVFDELAKQADAYSRCAFTLLSFERPEILDEDPILCKNAHRSVSQKLAAGLQPA